MTTPQDLMDAIQCQANSPLHRVKSMPVRFDKTAWTPRLRHTANARCRELVSWIAHGHQGLQIVRAA